jgi:hypothetical protein
MVKISWRSGPPPGAPIGDMEAALEETAGWTCPVTSATGEVLIDGRIQLDLLTTPSSRAISLGQNHAAEEKYLEEKCERFSVCVRDAAELRQQLREHYKS